MSETEAGVWIEFPTSNSVLIHGVTINYDLPPAKAVSGLPSNPHIASDYLKELWNGGKSGIVKGVTIPLCWPRNRFDTTRGRELQREIGYGLPAELVVLFQEGNHAGRIRHRLWDIGIRWIVALGESDRAIWRGFRPLLLDLDPENPSVRLGFTRDLWHSNYALIGAPVLP